MEKFCALAAQKEFKNPDSYYHLTKPMCGLCNMEIIDKSQGMQLKNCPHHLHKTCMEDAFAPQGPEEAHNFQNKCKVCHKYILDGLQEALKIPKLRPNKVVVKVNKTNAADKK